MCIPRSGVEYAVANNNFVVLADRPTNETVTFTYFEPTFSELVQYGPTFVWNGYAITDLQVNKVGEDQTVESRVLRTPTAPVAGEGIGLAVRATQGQGYFLAIGGEPVLNADVEILSSTSTTVGDSIPVRLMKLGPRRKPG